MTWDVTDSSWDTPSSYETNEQAQLFIDAYEQLGEDMSDSYGLMKYFLVKDEETLEQLIKAKKVFWHNGIMRKVSTNLPVYIVRKK